MILALPRPTQTLRRANPLSTRSKVVLGSALAIGIGATIFFKTRRAAAASQGAKAFTVSDDCKTITVIDEAAARTAAIAASLVVRPSPGDPAIEAARDVLVVVFPACGWTTIPSDLQFVHGGHTYSWAEITAAIGDRTVGELTQLVGATPALNAGELPRLLQWMLFGQPPVAQRRWM